MNEKFTKIFQHNIKYFYVLIIIIMHQLLEIFKFYRRYNNFTTLLSFMY